MDPRHLTLSEKDFIGRFPTATAILDWYDFELHGVKVDAKECVKNSWGRYHFFIDHHDRLVEEGGLYWLALKRRRAHAEPVLTHFKWMPAGLIQYTEEMVEQWARHTTNYELKEVFRIHWKKIWPELVNGAVNGKR